MFLVVYPNTMCTTTSIASVELLLDLLGVSQSLALVQEEEVLKDSTVDFVHDVRCYLVDVVCLDLLLQFSPHFSVDDHVVPASSNFLLRNKNTSIDETHVVQF